jgi:hypothetical protein
VGGGGDREGERGPWGGEGTVRGGGDCTQPSDERMRCPDGFPAISPAAHPREPSPEAHILLL